MKALIAKNQLVKAIEYISLANYKTDNMNDNAISISCDNYVISLSGANDENHVEIILEAEIEEPGDIVISALNLDKQIKGFPGKEILITGNDNFIYFETSEDIDDSMKCNMKVSAVETTKFKDLTPNKTIKILTVNGGDLSLALSSASIAVDKKAAKEELRNVGVILSKDIVDFVGFSNNRLSKYSVPTKGSNDLDEKKIFTIPLTVAKNIAKMFKKGKTDVTVSLEKNNFGNYIKFQNAIATIRCKILNFDYPDYDRILKNKSNSVITFTSANLKRAITSLGGLSKGLISVTMKPLNDTTMEFSINTNESNIAIGIPCTIVGDKVCLKILGKDLKEAFSCMTSNNCSLHSIMNSIYIFKDENNYTFMGSFCK